MTDNVKSCWVQREVYTEDTGYYLHNFENANSPINVNEIFYKFEVTDMLKE